jgi:hypothetical protein
MRISGKAALLALFSALLLGTAISDEGNDLSGGGGTHVAYLRLPDGRFHHIRYTNFGGLAIAQSDIILGSHADVQKQTAYNLAKELDALDYNALKQKRPDVNYLKMRPPAEVVSPFSYAFAPNTAGHKPWPGGKVPFTIDPSITDAHLKHAIETAVAAWNKQDIVQIRPVQEFPPYEIAGTQPLRLYSTAKLLDDNRSPSDPDKHRCFSHIGYDTRPPQGEHDGNFMYLSNKCSTGNIVHEIGHVLGLQHEHVRSDRDNFMDANLSVIDDEHQHDYAKSEGQTFGLVYDPCSILHYGDTVQKEWTTTGQQEKWFTWKVPGQAALDACRKTMHKAECAQRAPGQRCELSPMDIEIIRRLYR